MLKRMLFAVPAALMILTAGASALEVTVDTTSGKDWQKSVFHVNGAEYIVTDANSPTSVGFADNGAIGTIMLNADGQYQVTYLVSPAPAAATPAPASPTPLLPAFQTPAPVVQRTVTFDETAEGTHALLSGPEGNDIEVSSVSLGIVYTTLHLSTGDLRLKTSDLTFSTMIPANVKTALILSKATVYAEPDSGSAKQGAVTAGHVVAVLEIRGDYTRIKTDGAIGWVRTSNIHYYGAWSAVSEGIVTYKGKTSGTGNVFVRSDSNRKASQVTKWHVGTTVTIMSETRDWYEVEANGMHGWLMKENVTVQQ